MKLLNLLLIVKDILKKLLNYKLKDKINLKIIFFFIIYLAKSYYHMDPVTLAEYQIGQNIDSQQELLDLLKRYQRFTSPRIEEVIKNVDPTDYGREITGGTWKLDMPYTGKSYRFIVWFLQHLYNSLKLCQWFENTDSWINGNTGRNLIQIQACPGDSYMDALIQEILPPGNYFQTASGVEVFNNSLVIWDFIITSYTLSRIDILVALNKLSSNGFLVCLSEDNNSKNSKYILKTYNKIGLEVSISQLPICIHLNEKRSLPDFSDTNNLSVFKNFIIYQQEVKKTYKQLLKSDVQKITKYDDPNHPGNISYSYADLITLCMKGIPSNLDIKDLNNIIPQNSQYIIEIKKIFDQCQWSQYKYISQISDDIWTLILGYLPCYQSESTCIKCQSMTTKQCSRCHITHFCSQKCQKDCWPSHKLLCHR